MATTSPISVLVVDDEHDVADSIAEVLELYGHNVTVAYNGSSGLDAALAAPPDVALLDIGMPGCDGWTLATRMRMRPETRKSLLVAVTAYGLESDRATSAAAGFDMHLLKPVEPTKLNELVEQARRIIQLRDLAL